MAGKVRVRRAQAQDAAGAAELLRNSIRELCRADHRDDPAVLAAWLANKTAGNLERWIADLGAIVLVAECDGALVAVGAVRHEGEITLNYVAPAARLRGASKAMVAALEGEARRLGVVRVRLNSTATARRFYCALGYTDTGAPYEAFGLASFPMARDLA